MLNFNQITHKQLQNFNNNPTSTTLISSGRSNVTKGHSSKPSAVKANRTDRRTDTVPLDRP